MKHRPHVVFRKFERESAVKQKSHDIPVFDHDTFGFAGRAGRIDDIGQVAGGMFSSSDRRYRRIHGYILRTDALGDREKSLRKRSGCQKCLSTAVFQKIGRTFNRRIGINRKISRA